MTVHFEGTPDEFERLLASAFATVLAPVLAKLDDLLAKENQHMKNLDDLIADVTAQTTVVQSVSTLLSSLSAQLQAAVAAGDTAKIQQIATAMEANTASLSAAVTANTPAQTTSPAAP